MKQIIQSRIKALRDALAQKEIQAYIIPSTDPHLSEYPASHWQSREWISGFNGSAGTAVVTLEKAGLWTDSRYFIQAADQLADTDFELYKEMLPETPSIVDFLCCELPRGSKVGIDGKIFATTTVEDLRIQLSLKGIELVSTFDPIPDIWRGRPALPSHPVYVYDEKYAGKSTFEKIAEIRTEIIRKNADRVLLSSLDEIAWTLNLRGDDVKCNPVAIAYLLITQKETILFIMPEKITKEVKHYLEKHEVVIAHYNDVMKYLSTLKASSILLNPQQTNFSVFSSVHETVEIVRSTSPVVFLKAIRNEQEIRGIRQVMKKDGVALVKFLIWLEKAVGTCSETELTIDKKLHHYRAEQDLYKGESFNTIAGYGPHAAIVHYSATPESSATLYPQGFLLLDSGAHYLDGTTDITRTIALGLLTEEEKTDYTLVLKGHIALAMAHFPAGTRGTQLDALAHAPLWKAHINYLHGTGHGVGHFLSVHEGPQSIRMNENPVPLQPGMLTSNEPGVYKVGSHGIRTENLMLTVSAGEGMYGEYYRFETITLCPICKKGIIKELLTTEEINWLNEYHKKVYDMLSDSLNEEEKIWLKEATEKISL